MITSAQIFDLLPHRYPLLLVDRACEVVAGERIVTVKAVTCNEPWYANVENAADPDLSYPRSLLVESFVQSAAILAVLSQVDPHALRDKVMLFSAMSGVDFHRHVVPGDVIEHRVRIVRSLLDTMIFEGQSVVGANAVCTVSQVMLAFRPGEPARTAPAEPTRTEA